MSDGELSLTTSLCLDVVTGAIVLLVHGVVVHVLFFLYSDVEKKRKHTLNKHRSSSPIIPVEGALRMLQAHTAPRTLPQLCSLVGADRPRKQAMPVAKQEDLGSCVLWSLALSLQSVLRSKKVALFV